MDAMAGKKMTVTFYQQNHRRPDWRIDLSSPEFVQFFAEVVRDMARYGIELSRADNDAVTIEINSYGDLLNAVRISSPADGFSSLCVGHIIGKSAHLDLQEDIRRALDRVAFAPETIPPEDHNRKVCHNCGCGC
jgi:hypothetical protein